MIARFCRFTTAADPRVRIGCYGDEGRLIDLGSAAASANSVRVACPRGLVNDPYPGRCRHYVDSDGDGICDYSVAGSGSQVAGTFGEGGGGAFPGRRQGQGRP